MVQNIPLYNCHSHRKPLLPDEICIRNAYFHPLNNFQSEYLLSTGIHPWMAKKWVQHSFENMLEENLKNIKLIALGEIGLDKYSGDFKFQEEIFERQVAIGQSQALPLILHNVKSDAEIQFHLKNFDKPIILHGYSGNFNQWKSFNHGRKTMVSFGRNLFKPTPRIVDSLNNIPKENILLETDQANLTIDLVYQQFCSLTNQPLERLTEQLATNFKSVFATKN